MQRTLGFRSLRAFRHLGSSCCCSSCCHDCRRRLGRFRLLSLARRIHHFTDSARFSFSCCTAFRDLVMLGTRLFGRGARGIFRLLRGFALSGTLGGGLLVDLRRDNFSLHRFVGDVFRLRLSAGLRTSRRRSTRNFRGFRLGGGTLRLFFLGTAALGFGSLFTRDAFRLFEFEALLTFL